MKKKIIISLIITFLLSSICSYFDLVDIPDVSSMRSYQFNIITISTVFVGFSFTTLGIIMGFSSEGIIKQFKNTTVMIRKCEMTVCSIIHFVISSLISLAFIFDPPKSLGLGNLKPFIFTFGIMNLLMGIFVFGCSVYETYKIIRRIYGINQAELEEKLEAFGNNE